MLAVFLVAVTQLPPLHVCPSCRCLCCGCLGVGGFGLGYALGANGVLSGICRPVRWIHFDLPPGSDLSSTAIRPVLGVACFAWLANALLVDSYPKLSFLWRASVTRALIGLFVLGAGWLSLSYMVGLPNGWVLTTLFIIIVAASDVGAYFVGSTLGRNPLAPDVSPKKTIEGFWGACSCIGACRSGLVASTA